VKTHADVAVIKGPDFRDISFLTRIRVKKKIEVIRAERICGNLERLSPFGVHKKAAQDTLARAKRAVLQQKYM
jgi:hypothetical protein